MLFLAGMIVLYVAARSYSALAADRSYERLLAGAALTIAETLSATDGRITVDLPYPALDMLSAAPDDRVFYRIITPGGQTVTGYDDLPNAPEGTKVETSPQGAKFFEARYRGDNVRFVHLNKQVMWNGVIRSAGVQVGQTGQAREALARELVIGALSPIAIMTVLALTVVWFGIGIALRPLSRVSGELLRREPQELGALSGPVPKEVEPLVDALNGFMRRLNENILVLRTFIADAAHQIRTPLASLSAQAQLAVTEDGEELKASLASINRNAAKLTRLVNQLLSDATIQHRADVRKFESYDLLRAVRKAVREAVPQSGDSDVRLTTKLKSAPSLGDPLMIEEAIKNVIHNALVHGQSEDGEVFIEVVEEEERYVVRVCDRGPGIAKPAQEKVFERFVRSDRGTPGAGLGLAIVRQAIAAHGGVVQLLNRQGGGLEVRMEMPKALP
jgi:two-component system sensor histidine kinase TctE